MNEAEQRVRLKMLDELSKEMDSFQANSYREKGQPKAVAVVEEKTTEKVPETSGEMPVEKAAEAEGQSPSDPGQEKRFYLDPDRENVLQGVEAKAKTRDPDVERTLMQRGRYGRSLMG